VLDEAREKPNFLLFGDLDIFAVQYRFIFKE